MSKTHLVEFVRTLIVEVDVDDDATIDDIKEQAWQEFGAFDLFHSDFDINTITPASN